MKPDISRSLAMQNRARGIIPGMTQLLSKRPDMFAPGVWPGYYERASGVDVWDLDGNHYVDMSLSGIGANVLGYADPDVDRAVIEAIKKGSSSSLNCPEEVELATLLCELHPWAEMARFARTGGEAMAMAVRIARARTGRDKVAFCGYHGWHDWYLAANLGAADALGDHLLPGLNPNGVPKGLAGTAIPFRYNRIDELEAIVKVHCKELAAIVIEPIRNIDPKPGFLEGVSALAKEAGAVFIVDEVSAAFRMNTGGAHLLYNLSPDIAVFSKAMGNGYPIAAILGKSKVMDAAQSTFISSTMWTERTGPVAALATIKKHGDLDVGKHLMTIGQQVQSGWVKAAQKNELELTVSGIPPLSHFSFDYDNGLAMKALFVQLMLQKGFLASNLFYAMFAHQPHHVEKYLHAVSDVFTFIADVSRTNKLEEQLLGLPATPGFKRLT